MLHESVLWLSTQGEVDKCKEILLSIAKTNGKMLSPTFFDRFEKIIVENGQDERRAEESNMLHLFKSPRMRKISLLMIVAWVLMSSLFDAHLLNMANLNDSLYVSFTVSSLLELPADLIVIWGMDAVGRRWSCFLAMTLSGISMILSGYFYETAFPLTVFAMLGRFFITYAFNAGMQFQFEVFPTQLRAQGSAVASIMVMVFQILIPYIVYSGTHSGCLPFYILAALSLLGGLVCLFLPETAGVELPDSVEQAEALDRETEFFHIPCMARGKWRPGREENAV